MKKSSHVVLLLKAVFILPLDDSYFIENEFESFLICKGRYYNISTITSSKNKTKKTFPQFPDVVSPKDTETLLWIYILQQKIYRVVGSMNTYYILWNQMEEPF